MDVGVMCDKGEGAGQGSDDSKRTTENNSRAKSTRKFDNLTSVHYDTI